MPKVIISPIKRWPGTVTIADPLTFEQAKLVESGNRRPEKVMRIFREWKAAQEKYGENSKEAKNVLNESYAYFEYDDIQIHAVVACVIEWHLDNFHTADENKIVTANNFPGSPRKDSHELVSWIFSELTKIFKGDDEIPNT